MISVLSASEINEHLREAIDELADEVYEDDFSGIKSPFEDEAKIEYFAIAVIILKQQSLHTQFDLASVYFEIMNLGLPIYSYSFGKNIIEFVRMNPSQVETGLIEEALDLISINPNAYLFMDHMLETVLRDLLVDYSKSIVCEFLKK